MNIAVLLTLAAAAAAQPPQFEVASVKPGGDTFSTRPERSGGRIRWTTQLCYLIGYAHQLDMSQVSGKSCAAVYSVEATFDPAATDSQVRLMLQSLLEDRFRMRSHRVATPAEGFALVIVKSGLKLKEASPTAEPPELPAWITHAPPSLKTETFISAMSPEPGVIAITGRNVSMQQLATTLQRSTKTPVWDRTGLAGNYYFAFRFAPDLGPTDLAPNAPSLPTALQEALGLKLEKSRGSVESLVIDSLQPPTGN